VQYIRECNACAQFPWLSRGAAAVDDVEKIFVGDFDSLRVLVTGSGSEFIVTTITASDASPVTT